MPPHTDLPGISDALSLFLTPWINENNNKRERKKKKLTNKRRNETLIIRITHQNSMIPIPLSRLWLSLPRPLYLSRGHYARGFPFLFLVINQSCRKEGAHHLNHIRMSTHKHLLLQRSVLSVLKNSLLYMICTYIGVGPVVLSFRSKSKWRLESWHNNPNGFTNEVVACMESLCSPPLPDQYTCVSI